jgi:hypothetical protein
MDASSQRLLPIGATSPCHPASPVLSAMKGDSFDDILTWPTSALGRRGKTANARKNAKKTLLTADDVLAVERALDHEAGVCAQKKGMVTCAGSAGSGSGTRADRVVRSLHQSGLRVPTGEIGSSNPVLAALLARWDAVIERGT